MFLDKQSKNQVEYYERLLKAVGSLSNLFSESPEPYLASRATENLFCKAFGAENLSRSDASADASKEYEVGFVRQRSIFAGKLAFKVYDGEKHTGYVAYDIKQGNWLFPKGFKRTLYNFHRITDPYAFVVVSPLDVFIFTSKGYPNAVALMAKSMTDAQEQQILPIKHLILLHPEPENLVIRLSTNHFVRTLKTNKVADVDIKSLL